MNYNFEYVTPYKDISGVLWTRVKCMTCGAKFEAQGRPALIAAEHPAWHIGDDYVACPACEALLNPLGSVAYISQQRR